MTVSPAKSFRLSSEELIVRARSKGLLDKETALTYQVYAAFGDHRLPDVYKGDHSLAIDSDVLYALRQQWDSLPAAVRENLAPFLLSPDEPGSWYERQRSRQCPSCLTATARPRWRYIDTMKGNIRIAWPDDLPNGEDKAYGLATAIDTKIWDALAAIMQKDPVGLPPSPVNGKVNIGLVPVVGHEGGRDVWGLADCGACSPRPHRPS